MKAISYNIEIIHPDKTPAIWVHFEPSISSPVAYLRKPKWVSDKDWQNILKCIKFDAPVDFISADE